MIKNKQIARITENAGKRLRTLIILFSAGAAGVRFLLNAVYDVLLANLGSYALPVTMLAYFNQALSFCAIFALMAVAIYAYVTSVRGIFTFAVMMQAASHLFIITIGYCFFVYLLAYIDSSASVKPAFELSNFTLAALDSGGLVEILTVALFDFLVTMLFVLVSIPFIAAVRKKLIASGADLTPGALASLRWSDSPLKKPCLAFLVSFASISIISLIVSTVTDLMTEVPSSVSDYIVIATPYVMTVIYAAAGLLVMQIVSDKLSSKIPLIK